MTLTTTIKTIQDIMRKDAGVPGTDIFQRKCPSCQGGLPGIDY